MLQLKTILITTLVLLCTAFSSFPAMTAKPYKYSKEDLQRFKEAYSAKECKLVNDPKSPCNKGKEPFRDFLKKFNTSKIFRMSRLKPVAEPSRDNSTTDIKTMKFALCHDDGTFKQFPLITTGENDYSISSFFDVSADHVRYNVFLKPEPWEDGGGGNALIAVFRRINGLWYCTFAISF